MFFHIKTIFLSEVLLPPLLCLFNCWFKDRKSYFEYEVILNFKYTYLEHRLFKRLIQIFLKKAAIGNKL